MNGFRRTICLFFGHDYFLLKKLTPWSRKLGCKRCGQEFAMNDDCRAVVDWDDRFENLYRSHGIETE